MKWHTFYRRIQSHNFLEALEFRIIPIPCGNLAPNKHLINCYETQFYRLLSQIKSNYYNFQFAN